MTDVVDTYEGWRGITQPCDICGRLVAVNAVSPSENFCSHECAYKAYGLDDEPQPSGAFRPMNQLHLDQAAVRLNEYIAWQTSQIDIPNPYQLPNEHGQTLPDDIAIVLRALNHQPEVVEG